MADRDFLSMIGGFGLTTAEILYHLPDHPHLLQTYLWQDYDRHPTYPRLTGFLDFWTRNLDGMLNSVRVAHRGLVAPREFKFVDGQIVVH
ncbi:MAG: hypothetical protein R3D33_11885 [Hyphomicrobiaceae bacterium]